VKVSTQEQVQDLRQSIVELPGTFQYSCFHLDFNGKRINDFIELSVVEGLKAGSLLTLVEDPYTEKEARMHVVRVRELVGAAGDRTDNVAGICAGLSLHDSFQGNSGEVPSSGTSHPLTDYNFESPGALQTILPSNQEQQPKTVKSISLSNWNPPPYHLRQRGHLLYLQVTTNEGEQFHITSSVSGFFVNKCQNNKFDPFSRPAPKNFKAHSLLTLLGLISPQFNAAFEALQEYNNKADPLTHLPFANAIPFNPWLVPKTTSPLTAHQPDPTRTQEPYLLSGLDGNETLRDWNEEFQTTREIPKGNVQDRVFRERLTSKLFADYNDAAARGAVLVARGEIAPLNPTEETDAHIFVYNNIFFSFGADGAKTFETEGGDEAGRVAVGKDVVGVRAVNQLDLNGLFTTGTVIADYLGKRMVCQSIVPGIFKQREPGEHQIDYGGVEGREIVAEHEAFVDVFQNLSEAFRVKKHPVWDKEGKRHDLEASVETKGLLGTDGRKYVLDLYRLTPLDIAWLDKTATDDCDNSLVYPHRVAALRLELIDSYWRSKVAEFHKEELEKRRIAQKPDNSNSEPGVQTTATNATVNGAPTSDAADEKHVNGTSEEPAHVMEASDTATQETDSSGDTVFGTELTDSITKTIDSWPNGTMKETEVADSATKKNETTNVAAKDGISPEEEPIDFSKFKLAFNPDVGSGQTPQTEEEKEELARDEEDVRAVCTFLTAKVIPELLSDLQDGEVGFPMDGKSLSQLLHKRGINVRYLGKIAIQCKDKGPRLEALHTLCIREMVSRAFKHIVSRYLRPLPPPFASHCVAHMLNCLLGSEINPEPKMELDEELRELYYNCNFSFEKVTISSLKADIEEQVKTRYRYAMDASWMDSIRHIQLLREVSLKLGLQLGEKEYVFAKPEPQSPVISNGVPAANGMNGVHHEDSKKKKKKACETICPHDTKASTTFTADDILNIIPVIKEASPKSSLADEAYEAGRMALAQNQKDIGRELILESLSLHEQIYGVLHPEVAKIYHQLSMTYYNLEEKSMAVDLARKAVIVSERCSGVDSADTILSYLNLALFEHATQNTPGALTYIRRALELWKIIYGPNHPDSVTTMNNAAVMLQSLKHFTDSRLWFETSLSVCEELFGKQSPQAATILFQLAQALALDHDSKGAVKRMREAYNIYLAQLGPNDRNTKEAEGWLEQLTQNAVSIAKQAKDIQNRKYRRITLMPRASLGTRPQPQVGQNAAEISQSDPRSSIGLDSRSIDELLKFIEGDTGASRSKKRNRTANPKLRATKQVQTPVEAA
jgi:protein TIF31